MINKAYIHRELITNGFADENPNVSLTLKAPGKIVADNILEPFLIIFSEKIRLEISC